VSLIYNDWPSEHGMNAPTNERPASAALLGRLLDEHGASLALYAAQWTDAADDSVQEALVELARQPVVPEHVVAWLYRVVKHRALNAARGARRRREREARVAESRLAGATRQDALLGATIVDALEQLAEQDREIVVMRIWGGLTFEEVAAALSISTSTAHRTYQLALSRLRDHLEPPCSTNPTETTRTT
jgi:RNA polymerase sigma factor (sigma-70 family)